MNTLLAIASLLLLVPLFPACTATDTGTPCPTCHDNWDQAPCPKDMSSGYTCDGCLHVFQCLPDDKDGTLRWTRADLSCDCVNDDGTRSTTDGCAPK